ncbi:sensitivity to high expression protein she9 [Dissophora ornata]|nr:sensitivity to high expression protein she9 [Dissophora ornata]
MVSYFSLIRPVGSLARGQAIRYQFSNGRPITPGAVGLLLTRREFSGTASRNNDRSSSSSSIAGDGKGSGGLAGKDKGAQQALEGDAQRKLTEEVERKRVEAQDAALKEILENAAAEKQKLEEEALRAAEEQALRAAEEQARLLAKKAAEEKAAAKLQQQEQQNTATPAVPSRHDDRITSKETSGATTLAPKYPVAGSQLHNTAATSSTARQDASIESNQELLSAKETLSYTPGDGSMEPFTTRLLPYKKSLESSTEYIRSALPDSLRQLSESVKRKDYRDTIAQLSEHLNNFTGYNAVNDLKQKVITHGDSLDSARIKLVQAKQTYETAISTRSDTQKAINDLLQRKHLWSPDDVIRFTDLYRSEHANEQAEQRAKTEYKQAEADVESKSRMLTRVIMERYHEEQVWSDKIRAASTYGTWGLVGVNVMAFLIVQAFVEPRRRRKQVERYEELVQDLTERGVLPEKAQSAASNANGAGHAVAATESQHDAPVSTVESSPVAVGGALLGGEDVLLKMMKSAERQEERLDRMENLLLKQSPSAPKVAVEEVHGSAETGEFVLSEDGAIVFLSEEGGSAGVDMGEAWHDDLARGSRISPSRLSLILKDGEAEVPATRRDFLLSGLGGALIGGLVTVAVMMNR